MKINDKTEKLKKTKKTKVNNDTIEKINNNIKGIDTGGSSNPSSPYEEGTKLMNIMMDKLFDNEVVGTKTLRNNLSSFISKAINNFQEVLTGNASVKGGKTVSILSTEVVEDLLKAYKFEPIVNIDKEAGSYEIIINEIGAAADGDSLEDTIEILSDNIVILTEDYFEKLEYYKGIDNMRKMLPYFLKIKHCNNVDELMTALGLEKLKI